MSIGTEYLGWLILFLIVIGAWLLAERYERKHHRRDSLWIKSFRDRER